MNLIQKNTFIEYRISKASGKLTGEEEIFNDIKSFLNNDAKSGGELWLWIYNSVMSKKKKKAKEFRRCTAEELRKYIKEKANGKN